MLFVRVKMFRERNRVEIFGLVGGDDENPRFDVDVGARFLVAEAGSLRSAAFEALTAFVVFFLFVAGADSSTLMTFAAFGVDFFALIGSVEVNVSETAGLARLAVFFTTSSPSTLSTAEAFAAAFRFGLGGIGSSRGAS